MQPKVASAKVTYYISFLALFIATHRKANVFYIDLMHLKRITKIKGRGAAFKSYTTRHSFVAPLRKDCPPITKMRTDGPLVV